MTSALACPLDGQPLACYVQSLRSIGVPAWPFWNLLIRATVRQRNNRGVFAVETMTQHTEHFTATLVWLWTAGNYREAMISRLWWN